MKRFYINKNFTTGETIYVADEIVRHINVLRLKTGENIELFNGNNQTYHGEILDLDRRKATLKIIKKNLPSPIPAQHINLAIALVANDKMDLIIQKAVELGVSNIIPVYTERSARLVSERSSNRLTHWQNIIISSCCQCGQNQLPGIALPIMFDTLINKSDYDLKIIMNPHHTTANTQQLPQPVKNINNSILLVGPEGGFTNHETEQASVHNYNNLQLGDLILRAETGVIAGLSILNSYLNIWNI